MMNPFEFMFRSKPAAAVTVSEPPSSMDVRLQIAQLDKSIAHNQAKFTTLHKKGDPAAKAAFLTMKGLIATRCGLAAKLLMIEYNKAATVAQKVLEPVKEALAMSSPVMQEQFEQLRELSFDANDADCVLDSDMQAEYEAACRAIEEEHVVKDRSVTDFEPQYNVTFEVDDDA